MNEVVSVMMINNVDVYSGTSFAKEWNHNQILNGKMINIQTTKHMI